MKWLDSYSFSPFLWHLWLGGLALKHLSQQLNAKMVFAKSCLKEQRFLLKRRPGRQQQRRLTWEVMGVLNLGCCCAGCVITCVVENWVWNGAVLASWIHRACEGDGWGKWSSAHLNPPGMAALHAGKARTGCAARAAFLAQLVTRCLLASCRSSRCHSSLPSSDRRVALARALVARSGESVVAPYLSKRKE